MKTSHKCTQKHTITHSGKNVPMWEFCAGFKAVFLDANHFLGKR